MGCLKGSKLSRQLSGLNRWHASTPHWPLPDRRNDRSAKCQGGRRDRATSMRRPLSLLLAAVVAVFVELGIGRTASAAPACSTAKMHALLAPAATPDEAVHLDCSPDLRSDSIITKRIVLAGHASNNVAIDCGNGRIGRPTAQPTFPHPSVEIRSQKTEGSTPRWERPSGIVIKNCQIDGPIRIWGFGLNGQSEDVRLSSFSLGHTERAQAAAPTGIRIEDSTLTAFGLTPLYLGPGVTDVTLQRSKVRGTAPSIAIYLDAESARNTIARNDFEIATGREIIAVDGSAHNTITGNTFRIGWRGGIYLYRNCGEGGTVRHQTPSNNKITDNRFRYASPLHQPAINVGSRNGWSWYCHKDNGYPFGSSIDDRDNAAGNVVSTNTIE